MAPTTTPTTSTRIHGLDALRAVMMSLGIVLHSALTYTTVDMGNAWALKDPESTGWGFDFLADFIHTFRMPLFFLVAGYFGALLFYKRGPRAMLANRAKRILFPFLAFLFIIWPLHEWAIQYSLFTFGNSPHAAQEAWQRVVQPGQFRPRHTMHLWFLHYLMWLSALGWLLGLLLNKLPRLHEKLLHLTKRLMHLPVLAVLVLAALTFLGFIMMGSPSIETPGGFAPRPLFFYFYGIPYGLGWLLYRSQFPLQNLAKQTAGFLVAGLAAYLFKIIIYLTLNPSGAEAPLALVLVITAINALCLWLLSLGFTGLFLKYLNKPSARYRYFSDASYWLYLIHLPLTIAAPALLYHTGLPAFAKGLLVMLASLGIGLVTYHWGVRSTFVGQFLNGRKLSRSLPPKTSVA